MKTRECLYLLIKTFQLKNYVFILCGLYVYVWVPECSGMHVDARGQLAGTDSLHYMCSGD